jgi:uncharacterized protein YceH (UPF0502 family)
MVTAQPGVSAMLFVQRLFFVASSRLEKSPGNRESVWRDVFDTDVASQADAQGAHRCGQSCAGRELASRVASSGNSRLGQK